MQVSGGEKSTPKPQLVTQTPSATPTATQTPTPSASQVTPSPKVEVTSKVEVPVASPAAPSTRSTPSPQTQAPTQEPSQSPSPSKTAGPVEGVDCADPKIKCVALTFDDGPGRYTADLLNLFSERGVRATFYVQGSNVGGYPGTMELMQELGMEIGNHSWDHREFTRLSSDSEKWQVTATDEALRKVGVKPAGGLRPPYGAYDKSTLALGQPLVLWDVDPEDWRKPGTKELVRRVTAQVKPGSIVVMHDVHRSTVEAMPALLDALEAKGYTVVRVSDVVRPCGGLDSRQVHYRC